MYKQLNLISKSIIEFLNFYKDLIITILLNFNLINLNSLILLWKHLLLLFLVSFFNYYYDFLTIFLLLLLLSLTIIIFSGHLS